MRLGARDPRQHVPTTGGSPVSLHNSRGSRRRFHGARGRKDPRKTESLSTIPENRSVDLTGPSSHSHDRTHSNSGICENVARARSVEMDVHEDDGDYDKEDVQFAGGGSEVSSLLNLCDEESPK